MIEGTLENGDIGVFCCVDFMLATSHDFPFSKPPYLNVKTMKMEADIWTLACANKTKAGNISKASIKNYFINLCPWCGARINE